jgi:hypothetical protein
MAEQAAPQLATVPVARPMRSQLDRFQRIHDALTTEIGAMSDEIARLRRDHPMIGKLHTLPDVGLFGALFLVVEIGTIERFASAPQLAVYAGLVPSIRSFGGKTTFGATGHWSIRWRKWILLEITQSLKQAPGPVGHHYRRLLQAKGKSKATTAVARKLCCYFYCMWNTA